MNFLEIYDIKGKKWLICLNYITRIEFDLKKNIIGIYFPDDNIYINESEFSKIKSFLNINFIGD